LLKILETDSRIGHNHAIILKIHKITKKIALTTMVDAALAKTSYILLQAALLCSTEMTSSFKKSMVKKSRQSIWPIKWKPKRVITTEVEVATNDKSATFTLLEIVHKNLIFLLLEKLTFSFPHPCNSA